MSLYVKYDLRRIRKIAKSDYQFRHVCPQGTTRLARDGFHEISYFGVFSKNLSEIQVLLKSDKNNRYFT